MKSTKVVQAVALSVVFALGSLAATPVVAGGGDHYQKQVQQEYRHKHRPAHHKRSSKQHHHGARHYRNDHYRHHAGRYKHHGRNRYNRGYDQGYEDARDRYDDNDDLGLALMTGVLLSNMIFY